MAEKCSLTQQLRGTVYSNFSTEGQGVGNRTGAEAGAALGARDVW